MMTDILRDTTLNRLRLICTTERIGNVTKTITELELVIRDLRLELSTIGPQDVA